MAGKSYTLTSEGVALFCEWYKWMLETQPKMMVPDTPLFTPEGYASLHAYFLTMRPTASGEGTFALRSAHSRVVGTAQFTEFLNLNAIAFLSVGVVRATRLTMDPHISAKHNSFFMLNWTGTCSTAVHSPLIRAIGVAYLGCREENVATWMFGNVDVQTGEITFEDGSKDKLYLNDDEFVVDAQAVEWLKLNPNAVFVRLNALVPVLYSNQTASMHEFLDDIAFLKTKMVLDNVNPGSLLRYGGVSVRSFMETNTKHFVLFSSPCAT